MKYSKVNAEELPTFIIADTSTLLLICRGNGKRTTALWTNYDVFMKALKTLFIELWNNDE